MADVKLSQIASGGAINTGTDVIVGVRNGTTDVLLTPSGNPNKRSVGAGSYIRFSFTGTTATLNFDTSNLGANPLILRYSVDGAPFVDTDIQGTSSLSLGGTLSNEQNSLYITNSSATDYCLDGVHPDSLFQAIIAARIIPSLNTSGAGSASYAYSG
jgi:hypothetical protein